MSQRETEVLFYVYVIYVVFFKFLLSVAYARKNRRNSVFFSTTSCRNKVTNSLQLNTFLSFIW